jgi:hypothetical protein
LTTKSVVKQSTRIRSDRLRDLICETHHHSRIGNMATGHTHALEKDSFPTIYLFRHFSNSDRAHAPRGTRAHLRFAHEPTEHTELVQRCGPQSLTLQSSGTTAFENVRQTLLSRLA